MYATNVTLATETDTYVSTSKEVVNKIGELKSETTTIKNYDPVKYSSNNNKEWMTIDRLNDWIEKNRKEIGRF